MEVFWCRGEPPPFSAEDEEEVPAAAAPKPPPPPTGLVTALRVPPLKSSPAPREPPTAGGEPLLRRAAPRPLPPAPPVAVARALVAESGAELRRTWRWLGGAARVEAPLDAVAAAPELGAAAAPCCCCCCWLCCCCEEDDRKGPADPFLMWSVLMRLASVAAMETTLLLLFLSPSLL